jgi:hypothetical protein
LPRSFLHRSKCAKPDRKGACARFGTAISALANVCFSTEWAGKCEFFARARQPRPNAESRHSYGLETAIPSALPQGGFGAHTESALFLMLADAARKQNGLSAAMQQEKLPFIFGGLKNFNLNFGLTLLISHLGKTLK